MPGAEQRVQGDPSVHAPGPALFEGADEPYGLTEEILDARVGSVPGLFGDDKLDVELVERDRTPEEDVLDRAAASELLEVSIHARRQPCPRSAVNRRCVAVGPPHREGDRDPLCDPVQTPMRLRPAEQVEHFVAQRTGTDDRLKALAQAEPNEPLQLLVRREPLQQRVVEGLERPAGWHIPSHGALS